MILRPAGRFLIGPLPPAVFAARPLAAVIRPPLLFFAIMLSLLMSCLRFDSQLFTEQEL
jgi:hypothetical protein